MLLYLGKAISWASSMGAVASIKDNTIISYNVKCVSVPTSLYALCIWCTTCSDMQFIQINFCLRFLLLLCDVQMLSPVSHHSVSRYNTVGSIQCHGIAQSDPFFNVFCSNLITVILGHLEGMVHFCYYSDVLFNLFTVIKVMCYLTFSLPQKIEFNSEITDFITCSWIFEHV